MDAVGLNEMCPWLENRGRSSRSVRAPNDDAHAATEDAGRTWAESECCA